MLFKLKLNNIYYWDIIRRDVFILINKKISGQQILNTKESNILTIKISNVFKGIKNYLIFRYYLIIRPKYIFTNFRRELNNNIPYDFISEIIYEKYQNESVSVEFIDKKTVSYIKLFLAQKTNIPPFSILKKHDIDIFGIADFVQSAIVKHFNIELNLKNTINHSIQEFLQLNHIYQKLFNLTDIKAVIGSNDGSLKGLYNAANNKNIISIEMQHGISPKSIMWTYHDQSVEMSKYYVLPKYFLTFSNYWNDKINYPVKKILECGNNYFYFDRINGENNIVLITNLNNYESFDLLAKSLSKFYSEKFVYLKLHPEQYNEKYKIKESFFDYKNVIVLTNEIDIYTIFKKCTHVVGVRSTFLYLSIQAGKNVYIKKSHNYDWDRNLLQYVDQFTEEQELISLINSKVKNPKLFKSPIFFEKLDFNIIDNLFIS